MVTVLIERIPLFTRSAWLMRRPVWWVTDKPNGWLSLLRRGRWEKTQKIRRKRWNRALERWNNTRNDGMKHCLGLKNVQFALKTFIPKISTKEHWQWHTFRTPKTLDNHKQRLEFETARLELHGMEYLKRIRRLPSSKFFFPFWYSLFSADNLEMHKANNAKYDNQQRQQQPKTMTMMTSFIMNNMSSEEPKKKKRKRIKNTKPNRKRKDSELQN